MQVTSTDEIQSFLALPARERFASIVADFIHDFGVGCELPVTHTFSDGMYTREMFIPKNTIVIGRVHKKECINICSKGSLNILSFDGEVFQVSAPFNATSQPGSIKIGFALEDSIWINVFRTDAIDIDSAERECAFSALETLELIDPSSKFIKREAIWHLD